jgi:hypothetical protein
VGELGGDVLKNKVYGNTLVTEVYIYLVSSNKKSLVTEVDQNVCKDL